MSFPRYPAYKDSGVTWLGEVPSHWEVKRLRRAVQLNPSKSETNTLPRSTEVTFLPMEAIGEDGSLVLDRVRPIGELEAGYTYFAEDDVAIAKITPCFENGKGAVMRGLHGGLGFGTTELIVARPLSQHLESTYLHRIFTSRPFMQQGEASMYGAGGQKRVPDDFVRGFAIALPPVDEQAVINAFLDRETAKIDALVAEQVLLITLLKEKRQAVISHAVTKGLDPSVRMKDSGVEWLGEVPEHWLFGPVKHFLALRGDAIKTGPFGSHLTAAEMQVGSIKVYNQRNVIDCDFEGGDNFITEEKFQELRSFETYPGDLLITTRGTIGRAAILPSDAERGILHPCLLRVQPDTSRLRTQFLRALVQDSDLLRTQLSYLSNATTIEVIYSYTIASVVIPVPPVDEQDAILDALTEKLAELDNLTQEAQRAVELLQERRSALISAAVTGQIDVRGLAT